MAAEHQLAPRKPRFRAHPPTPPPRLHHPRPRSISSPHASQGSARIRPPRAGPAPAVAVEHQLASRQPKFRPQNAATEAAPPAAAEHRSGPTHSRRFRASAQPRAGPRCAWPRSISSPHASESSRAQNASASLNPALAVAVNIAPATSPHSAEGSAHARPAPCRGCAARGRGASARPTQAMVPHMPAGARAGLAPHSAQSECSLRRRRLAHDTAGSRPHQHQHQHQHQPKEHPQQHDGNEAAARCRDRIRNTWPGVCGP